MSSLQAVPLDYTTVVVQILRKHGHIASYQIGLFRCCYKNYRCFSVQVATVIAINTPVSLILTQMTNCMAGCLWQDVCLLQSNLVN